MVQNGYFITISSENLLNFVQKLKADVAALQKTAVLKALAAENQKLYDAKFVEGAKYPNKSISQYAAERVQNMFDAVRNGSCAYAKYDLRCSVILFQNEEKENGFFCLFNSMQPKYKEKFESYPEVHSYKFFIDGPEPGISKEENIARGEFWHNVLESCGWDRMQLGAFFQIAAQPRIEDMSLSAKDIKSYFDPAKKRAKHYAETQAVVQTVKDCLGVTPIDKIPPYELVEIFQYAASAPETAMWKKKILRDTEKGFLTIDVGNLSLVDAAFEPPENAESTNPDALEA